MRNEGEGGSDRYSELAIKYAREFLGKIQTIPKVPVTSLDDFSIWYTPGVAAVSKEISKDRDLSFEMTWRWNSVAIVTDGTRVLGLGNVGPEASLPVMEGKGLIFKYLGGVDAVPIPLNVHDKDQIANVVRAMEPAFGGINLEDIESPKCFYLLQTLRDSMNIPVWHDDQLGTAGATLAGLINALKITGRKESDTKVVVVGSGAANIATVNLLSYAGFNLKNITMVDSHGILHPEREDMDILMRENPWKYDLALKTNGQRKKGDIAEAMEGADAVIAASKQGPGIIKGEWVRKMEKRGIIFALANPIPEIWPNEARENGAEIVATGRSDFANQVNNSLVFPGVFRGALDARVKKINERMIVEAARELAAFAEEKGISDKYIIPTMEEWEVFPRVAAAIAYAGVQENLARVRKSKSEFLYTAREIIKNNRIIIEKMIDQNLIRSVTRI